MHQVKVYTTPTCSWCQAVKDYLRSRQVEFEEVDVSTDIEQARRLVEKTGQYGVPVIDIDGQYIVGFDRDEINTRLNLS